MLFDTVNQSEDVVLQDLTPFLHAVLYGRSVLFSYTRLSTKLIPSLLLHECRVSVNVGA